MRLRHHPSSETTTSSARAETAPAVSESAETHAEAVGTTAARRTLPRAPGHRWLDGLHASVSLLPATALLLLAGHGAAFRLQFGRWPQMNDPAPTYALLSGEQVGNLIILLMVGSIGMLPGWIGLCAYGWGRFARWGTRVALFLGALALLLAFTMGNLSFPSGSAPARVLEWWLD